MTSRRYALISRAAWTSYAGRVITFNLAAATIHLAVLRWIFLRIGG